MSEFGKLCKEFENLDVKTYNSFLEEKAAKIIPALDILSIDGQSGPVIFSNFIIGSIVADGRITEEEYLLVYPLLRDFFGSAIDYEQCKALLDSMKPESREIKNSVNKMVDMLGEISDDLKDDIIIVCMLICAVDGKISLREKNWIKQLIRVN